MLPRSASHLVSKNALSLALAFPSAILILSSCQTSKKVEAYGPVKSVSIPQQQPVTILTGPGNDSPTLLARPLTSVGENSEAHFSPDGQHVLYHSKSRGEHKQTQIYEINLTTMRERRVTFHDGEDSGGVYLPDGGHVLYSSTTDEIKEDPEVINRVMRTYGPQSPKNGATAGSATDASTGATADSSRFPLAEVYTSRLDGNEIRRLTRSPGFDGDAVADSKGKYIIFASERDGGLHLFSMNLQGAILKHLTHDANQDRHPVLSPDDHALLWTRTSPDLKSSQLILAEGVTGTGKGAQLTTKTAQHLDPAWLPNGQEMIFSSNRVDGSHFELYMMDRKGVCLRRLTDGPGDKTDPQPSPDGKKILFTSNQTGRKQIYLMDLQPPKGCLNEVP
jgi:TolB protein